MEPSPSSSSPPPARRWSPEVRRVRKQALEEVLEQVQRAVEMLRDGDPDLGVPLLSEGEDRKGGTGDDADDGATSSVASDSDYETAQAIVNPLVNLVESIMCICITASSMLIANAVLTLVTTRMCDLLKSKVESLEFLKKLEDIQKSVYQDGAVEPDISWDIVKAVDLWEDDDPDDGYVLVKQEDIVDGITSFMAAYLLSLKKTKDLSPDQLQNALRKTFSAEKKKSRIRKAWDGTKVIYNVASWGATAVGVYNNRALLTVATTAFRTSSRVISKFL
ncbi:hypothetical protein C2845_PM04G18450 [Panicum miliaceum]|uniref:Uncharacterized protein n=1 Tax=Panicum miliaceum TaxID=4540 RepID=A0A3L6QU41_PANMI|nr:hypothetical protein C2845_PM04G18450 [Panicum miliaceum]